MLVIGVFTDPDQKFEIGKAVMLSEGTDVTIIATGHLVWEALQAAEVLESKGISAEVNISRELIYSKITLTCPEEALEVVI